MICDFGDVVVVPFPFVDADVFKRRPALVLSSSAFNEGHGQTILAMITTGARSDWPSDIRIADLEAAGLRHASRVRWKLFTLSNDQLLKKAGMLSGADRAAVSSAARSIVAA